MQTLVVHAVIVHPNVVVASPGLAYERSQADTQGEKFNSGEQTQMSIVYSLFVMYKLI